MRGADRRAIAAMNRPPWPIRHCHEYANGRECYRYRVNNYKSITLPIMSSVLARFGARCTTLSDFIASLGDPTPTSFRFSHVVILISLSRDLISSYLNRNNYDKDR